ncbi:predicted protein [Plenodomus lingam JN3]|uniref:Predicted protein n=1 Tax=Leptosphaeria maculans (strain JN3 / isolate v23.1.3 / race Av1-4-5-6-7-8) TaxID=985895 RepID=E4ZKF6_LEPMJ|nr:predicted protein [Plenodomus lingam JN3]CBX91751.1 predicted protein [Plenodomus lingam JN3]
MPTTPTTGTRQACPVSESAAKRRKMLDEVGRYCTYMHSWVVLLEWVLRARLAEIVFGADTRCS